MKVARVLGGLIVAAVAPTALAAQTTITVPPGCCGNYIYPWGTTYIFGQTFLTPNTPGLLLQNITTSLFSRNGGSVFYSWHVYQWNGTGTTGSSLYTSATTAASNSPTWFSITTATGGVAVQPNQMYVFFLEATSGTGEYGQSAGDFNNPYAPGTFVYSADGGATWTDIGEPYDLAFTMDFTATPEPISMVLLGTGLAGVGAAYRRKRLTRDEIPS